MIKRTIAWPLFMVISMISAIGYWVNWNIGYVRFGGEVIIAHSEQRKTIADIYNKLSESADIEDYGK